MCYWGLLTAVEFQSGGTQFSVDRVRPLEGSHSPQELVLRSTGARIAFDFIRPYAICRTPDFLSEQGTPSRPPQQTAASSVFSGFGSSDPGLVAGAIVGGGITDLWRQIPNNRLTLADVPAAGAPWDAISEFALSYYCHTDEGSVRGEYDHRHPPLEADLDTLRAWLFSRQRSIRGGYMGDPDDDPVMLAPVRQVIEAIRLRVAAGAG